MKENVMDVVAACGPSAVAAVDKLGFEFLAENGYPEAAERWSASLQDRIRKRMNRNAHRLIAHGSFDEKLGQYVVWFTLRRGKRVLVTSRAVRLQGKALEGRNDAQG